MKPAEGSQQPHTRASCSPTNATRTASTGAWSGWRKRRQWFALPQIVGALIIMACPVIPGALAAAPDLAISFAPLTVSRDYMGDYYLFSPCQARYYVPDGGITSPAYLLAHFFGPGGVLASDQLIAYPDLGLAWILARGASDSPTYMPVISLKRQYFGRTAMMPFNGDVPKWLDLNANLATFTQEMQARGASVERVLQDDNSVLATATEVTQVMTKPYPPVKLVAHFPSDRALPADYVTILCR